jgi:hypothetical protein
MDLFPIDWFIQVYAIQMDLFIWVHDRQG